MAKDTVAWERDCLEMERVTIAPGLSGVFYPAKEVAPSACLLVLHGFGDHARYCETANLPPEC